MPEQHLLLASGDLSGRLHLMHGLQPAFDKLSGAQHQRSKRRGEGAGSRILQVTGRTQRRGPVTCLAVLSWGTHHVAPGGQEQETGSLSSPQGPATSFQLRVLQQHPNAHVGK